MSGAAAATTSPSAIRFAGARAVFERDFLVFTSRPRFLVLRTLVVLLPALTLCTALVISRQFSSSSSSANGSAIFGISIVVLPAITLLLAPILAASSIASERALQTLPIVLATPVSPLSFVAAKFASRLGVALVLFLATLPLLGTCFLYGGVAVGSFLDLCAFVAGLAVLGAAAGLVSSAFTRGVAAATRVSYGLAIAVPLLHLAVLGLWVARRSSRKFENGLLLDANPFYAWGRVGESAFTGVTLKWPGAVFLAWTLGFAAVAIALSAWRIGREAATEAASVVRGGRVRDMRFANPVLDRGLRGTLILRPRFKSWLALAFLVIVDGLVLTTAAANGRSAILEAAPHVAFLAITTVVVSLHVMSSAASAIASERETGALDMLLATRLRPVDVVNGKFGAVLLGAAPLVGLAFLHGVVAAIFTNLPAATVVAWLLSTSVVCVFFAAFALWCSASAASTTRASLRAWGFLIGGTFAHGVVAGVTTALCEAFLHSSDWAIYVFGASPIYVGGFGLSFTLKEWSSESGHLAAAWVIWSAAYLVATAGFLGWTVARLARRNEAD